MKKFPTLLSVLITLSILLSGFTSCSQTQDMSMDYKDSTFVNQFTGLIKTVNNNDSIIATRFAALNKLLDAGMASLVVAVDSNTNVITALNQTTKNGLDSIKTSLFNGFTVLTVHMDANSDSIVNAINKNGEGLRLQIDNTGKLISGSILSQTDAEKSIHDAVNALTATYTSGIMTKEKYLTQMLTARNALHALDTTKYKDALTLLASSLKKGGVTIGNDKKSLVLNYDVWKIAENRDSASVFYVALNGAIDILTDKTIEPNFTVKKLVSYDGQESDLAKFNGPSTLGGSDKLYGLLLDSDPHTDTETGNLVVKVVKTFAYYQYTLQARTSGSGLTNNKYYCIRGYDARGDYQVYAQKDAMGPRIKVEGRAAEKVATTTHIANSVKVSFKVIDKGNFYTGAYKVYAFEWYNANPAQYCILFWPSEK